MRLKDAPVYEHVPGEHEGFRGSMVRRIKRQLGSFSLVDTDIAFESPATNPGSEELDAILAEFRATERLLREPQEPKDTDQLTLF